MKLTSKEIQIAPTADVASLARSLKPGKYLFISAPDAHEARSFAVIDVCGAAIYDLSYSGSDIERYKLERGGNLRRLQYE